MRGIHSYKLNEEKINASLVLLVVIVILKIQGISNKGFTTCPPGTLQYYNTYRKNSVGTSSITTGLVKIVANCANVAT